MKDLIKIIWLSIFFTTVIYFINYSFFWDTKKNIETNIAIENFIEKEVTINKKSVGVEKQIKTLNKSEKNKLNTFYKNKKNYNITYIPKDYKNNINIFEKKIITILEKNLFKRKITTIEIELIKDKRDRRWKMKNKTIKLFWLTNNLENEYMSVFIHEFAHYIDLYFLDKKVFFDISSKFYEISWESTKIKKHNQKQKDFTSGYAMTNKYEDFAETFTYYILHNKDFLEKTKNSKFLKEKYDFFSLYIFKKKEFFATNFHLENKKIQDYYRDITKIPFSEKKLFSYLKKLK